MSPHRASPLLAAALAIASAPHAIAATFTVTHQTDAPQYAAACTSEACTLRGAVSSANAQPGPHTIVLPGGLYVLGATGADEDANLTGDLDIHEPMTLVGAGPAATFLQGSAAVPDRLIDYHRSEPDHRLVLRDLTLRNGDAGAGDGGAVRSRGALRVDNVAMHDNEARVGGAIRLESVPQGSMPTLFVTAAQIRSNSTDGGSGAGLSIVLACGAMRIEDTAFHDNAPGGAIDVTSCGSQPALLTVARSHFEDNYGGIGGAIHAIATQLRIEDSAFLRNGGAIEGGAILATNGITDILRSVFEGNYSINIGGAIWGEGGAFAGHAPRLIEDSLFVDNRAGQRGGALHFSHRNTPFTIRRSRFFDNDTVDTNNADSLGGALFRGYVTDTPDGAPDRIEDSHFEANISGDSANDQAPGGGGAILVQGATPLHIERSSFVGNVGKPGSALLARGCGGGDAVTLTVLNSTFADNTDLATTPNNASALRANGCTIALESSTVHAPDGASLGTADTGRIILRNTLMTRPCYAATVLDDGGNIESPTDTCSLTALGSQPLMPLSLLALGPLRGADTRYYLPAPDSAVIDAGRAAPDCTVLDQRGFARTGRCDVGATEPSNPALFADGFEP